MEKTTIWKANLIVFVSSFCIMALELVAGRILAPYIGVSLYTWTSVIGVVLAGISLGNFLGGKVADRWPSPSTLGWLLFGAGITTLLVVLVTQTVTQTSLDLPLIPKILFLTTVIFFLPCCLMGMISPVVVKLTLQDLRETGSTIGAIYAFSALGSIAGTFATGFVLISLLGTRNIVAIIAITLIALAALAARLWRSKAQLTFMAICLLFAGNFIVQRNALASPCTLETDYFCINVSNERLGDGRTLWKLVLDHLIHSFVVIEDPTYLHYGYERIFAELARYLAGEGRALKTLSIGGGGYTFPRYLETVYPASTIEVVEIDPGVTRIAYSHLGLPITTTIRTHNEDARQFFMRMPPQGDYDLILGDAFNDLSVPYHLTTREFNALVKRFLKPDGVYAVNVIDNFAKGSFLKAFAYTLRQVFPYVYITAENEVWDWGGTSTYVIIAASQPLDIERFFEAQRAAGIYPTTHFLPADRLAAYLQENPILLTDDYAPVDNMIAPLFVERGF